MAISKEDLAFFSQLQGSPRFFVEKMFGLAYEPNPALFIKGKHYSSQQAEILDAVADALKGGLKRISIASGHGVGKSCCLSWLVLWFLFCYKDAQIPCTAPSTEQMYDVLWKELAKWLQIMPSPFREKYEWQNSYIRIVESPETWFARAKTARKETPEALAGVHGDHVMFLVDEASGVPNEIFNTAEGALTSSNAIFVMISNPTRLEGYFYDSHHSDRENWKRLEFSSENSPLVDKSFVDRIIQKNGKDSDEYRIRVLGLFPKEEGVDEKGFVPLLFQKDLRITDEASFVGPKQMGIDPSGEGDDETVWVLRDQFRAKIIGREKISNPKSIAQKTLTLMDCYEVNPENVTVDNFGVGANVAQELALTGKRVNAINVGEKARDEKTFINARAEDFWRLREWALKGGELIRDEGWDELTSLKFKRELTGKLKIISKDELRKRGIKSPNVADALMLTFHRQRFLKSPSPESVFRRTMFEKKNRSNFYQKSYGIRMA